jgi:monoamine oxidase
MQASAVTSVDVLIIGGGLSGLSAALKLKDENDARAPGQPPVTYLILEGSERLGGRTLTRGADRDFGAAYVGASQHHIQHLIRRFQLPMRRVFLPGSHQWLFESSQGVLQRLPGNDPTALPGGQNALLKLLELDTLALELRDHLHDPAQSRLAGYDAMSVAHWVSEQRAAWERGGRRDDIGMSPETEDAFVASVRSTFSVQPAELSFFFLLYYAATAGGYSALVAVAGSEGAEDLRFALGTGSLVSALAAAVGEHNIQLVSRVSELAYEAHGVTATSNAGIVKAKRAVIAMSPAHAAQLAIVPTHGDPAHAADRDRRHALCQAMATCMGRTIKGFVHFKRPFWREAGLMGYSVSVAQPFEQYPLAWTLDNAWGEPGATTESQYTLMTFIVADAARYWSTRPRCERALAVLAHLTQFYGNFEEFLRDQSDPAANYEDENWPEQIPSGLPAPAAMMPPNTLTRFGAALRAPIGPIHFAGSESATDWCGYMSGAVQAGFRAGAEVLAALADEPGA